jgi:polyisoprenoid-binding protein YceI
MNTTATRVYTIDAKHTSIGFSVRHLMIAKVRGTFGTVAGTIELGESGLIPTAVNAEIDIASIDTREAQRDAHLRSPDFFHVEQHPVMRFTSTGIEAEGDSRFRLTGELEIRGAKNTVTFEAEVGGHGPDPFGQGQRVAYEAKTKIKRSEFGLTYNSVLEAGGVAIGDDVEITLDVEAVGAATAA